MVKRATIGKAGTRRYRPGDTQIDDTVAARAPSRTPSRFTNIADAYDPEQPSPDEIAGARLDQQCPRCDRPGKFSDAGLCLCGFSY